MHTITVKFGGTSLASAAQIRKAAEIVHSDPARRFVVASAPGKRTKDDIKVTDLLYRCYNEAMDGDDFTATLETIRGRFQDIITELDGKTITSFQDIYDVLDDHKPDDKITVKAKRASN